MGKVGGGAGAVRVIEVDIAVRVRSPRGGDLGTDAVAVWGRVVEALAGGLLAARDVVDQEEGEGDEEGRDEDDGEDIEG